MTHILNVLMILVQKCYAELTKYMYIRQFKHVVPMLDLI